MEMDFHPGLGKTPLQVKKRDGTHPIPQRTCLPNGLTQPLVYIPGT